MLFRSSIPSIKVRVAHPRRPTPMTTFPAALDDGRVPYETQRGAHWCDGHTKVRYRIRNLGKVPAQGVTRRRRISGSPTRRWCCVDKILPCIYLFAFPLLFEEEDLSPDDGVVFEHAHGRRRPGPGHCVEETGHGHGDQAHRDDARLCLLSHDSCCARRMRIVVVG